MRDWLVLGVLALAVGACAPGSPGLREDSEARADCNSAAARIQALIAQGQFAEAEVLIAETSAAGLLAKPQATELLRRIAQFNTKLGEIPARLQRAKDFPSQLKEYTLYQIEKMMDDGDFSLATKAQLQEAAKLIKQQPRLMGKF
ncbi:hypothetical protein ACN28I_33895 [Archangium gephyra]|uniref:hypothetical protein n=1 Tax=Archangium gephyra TaxID=48 RepID=UPI003B79A54A